MSIHPRRLRNLATGGPYLREAVSRPETRGNGNTLTRRSLLLALSATPLLASGAARAGDAMGKARRRIVSLNWATSETLYALGVRPVGAAEIPGYDRMVGYPPTPSGVVDVGFQGDPNLELLASLRPDLLLIQSWQAAARPLLERFAPVEAFTVYDRGAGDPVAAASDMALRIADLAGHSAAGPDLVARVERVFSDCATRLRAAEAQAVLLVQALSPTNLVVFTRGSLFDSVMKRIGLTNAWSKSPTLLWGSTQIGVDALADYPQARIVWMASPDGAASQTLYASALWRQLPQVAGGTVCDLPLVWGFGGLPTAERFARLLTARLTAAA